VHCQVECKTKRGVWGEIRNKTIVAKQGVLKEVWFKLVIGKFSGEEFAKKYMWKWHTFWSIALDKQKTFYQQLNHRVKRTKEGETRSENNSNFGVTMPKSFDFEYMWSFNYPHLNVKDHWKKLCQVEVLVENGEFWTF
jgi:hypothetical protein